jgi:hypothetical protein
MGENKNYLFHLCSLLSSPLPLVPNAPCPIFNNLNILYIDVGKSYPLQLKIKMRAVDKTLIST